MNIKRYRQILMLIALIILLPVLAFAQTASEIDAMLAADTISSARAACFLLWAADLLPSWHEGFGGEAAIDIGQGWKLGMTTTSPFIKRPMLHPLPGYSNPLIKRFCSLTLFQEFLIVFSVLSKLQNLRLRSHKLPEEFQFLLLKQHDLSFFSPCSSGLTMVVLKTIN